MMYGMEIWPMTKETMYRLECTQMRMLRWMAGISRAERRTNASIREAFGVEAIEKVARQMRLRWYGHVEIRSEDHITQQCQRVEVEGIRPRGRPKATWASTVAQDLKIVGLRKEDAQDRKFW